MSNTQTNSSSLAQSCRLFLSVFACLIFTIAFVTFWPVVAAAAPATQTDLTVEPDALTRFENNPDDPLLKGNVPTVQQQPDSSDDGGEILFGIPITGTVRTPGQVDAYTFDAEEGDTIFVLMGSKDYLRPEVRIYGPDGPVAGECSARNSSKAIISSCTLTATGTHTILANDGYTGIYTGTYGISVQRTNDPGNAPSLSWSQTEAGSIHFPGQADSYSFVADAVSAVSLRMTSSEYLRPSITVFGPDGKVVDECKDEDSSSAEIPLCNLNLSGIHTIMAHDGYTGIYPGDYHITLSCVSHPCPVPLPLVLIYAVLDNNLGDDPETWERLANNVEQGMHDDVNVRLLLDGPGQDDSFVYDIQESNGPPCLTVNDPTCNGRYVNGQNRWRWSEDTAHPQTLYDFVADAVADYPNASTVSLSLVGHGAGWTANALPGQPSKWGSQPGVDPDDEEDSHEGRVGGLLWDDNPGSNSPGDNNADDDNTSRAMSTKALGVALNWIQNEIGQPLDLLYLDACSMGMAEIAYEVRGSAAYLLASPNTAWASFAYDDMLQSTSGDMTGREIGTAWYAAEKTGLIYGQYPFTLSLIDLSKLDNLADKTTDLANALNDAEHTTLLQAFAAADRYDTNYDGAIETRDSYVDLVSFSDHIRQRFAGNPTIENAGNAVVTAVGDAVAAHTSSGGHPWPYPGQVWQWASPGGLSIYLPLEPDEDKRLLYTAANLHWAADTNWDEFLTAFWARQPGGLHAAATELPTCISTRECEVLAEQFEVFPTVYLPMIQR